MTRWPFACAALALGAACQSPAPSGAAPAPAEQPAVAADAAQPLSASAAELVYVPVYSSIPTTDAARKLDLSVTLAVRNTDSARPIDVQSIRYFSAEGRLIQAYVERPVRLAPLAAHTVVIAETDTRAGVAGSFLVEWSAAGPIHAPVIEAVMIGARGQQGISFLSMGRILRHGQAPQL